MSEGGQFPWKVQKVDTSRGPPGKYDHISRREPLPRPPVGATWVRDEATREWSLVKCVVTEEDHVVAESAAKQQLSQGKDYEGGGTEGSVPVVKGTDVPEKEDGQLPPAVPPPKRSSSSFSSLPDDAVEGVDYVVHTVLPSDTFSGLCLRYKISAIHLRRANKFSGTNLRLAPSRLVIPLGKDGSKAGGRIRIQDKESPEYKLHEVMAAVPGLGSSSEARAYLLMSGWDVDGAIDAAREDLGWERSNEDLASRRSDMVTSRHGVVGGPYSGKRHGMWVEKSQGVEASWKEEPWGGCKPSSSGGTERDLTLHVDVAVPADPSAVELQEIGKEYVDEEKGGEGLCTPLLRHIELPRVDHAR